jgi:hypothetical protein
MTRFLIDDNFAMNKRVIDAGNKAIGLWVRAGAWSAANNTDGFLPFRVGFVARKTQDVEVICCSGSRWSKSSPTPRTSDQILDVFRN